MLRAQRLTAADRSEVLSVLNRSFSTDTHTADFERNLPIMGQVNMTTWRAIWASAKMDG